MRVIALGGGGAMGAVGARMAARTPGVTELVIADRDPASARTVAQGLADAVARPGGGPAVSTATIDVTDAAALRELIRGTDAVLNTTGPFFALGARVLRAAIDAGAHYLDICDDPEPTTELLALDAEARAAGVTAVVGAGASPGISNLLAALAAADLARPTLRRMTKSGLRARRYQGPGTLPPFFAAATGRREGRRLIVLARYDAASVGMAEATGVPLGLALAQVLDGTARRPGVHPVEAVLDAPRFFADLDRVGVGAGGARPAITEEPTGPATAHRRR